MARTPNLKQRVVYLTEEDEAITLKVITKIDVAGPTLQHRLGLRAIMALPARTLNKLVAELLDKENT